MIAFEVGLNGKRVCIAGADDLCVLTTNISAVGKLGTNTVPSRRDDTPVEIHYSVGGLTARSDPRKNVHMKWKSVERLGIGDVIQVRIVETDKADRAKSRTKAKPSRANQTVRRTGTDRSAGKANRRSGAAGSRR